MFLWNSKICQEDIINATISFIDLNQNVDQKFMKNYT